MKAYDLFFGDSSDELAWRPGAEPEVVDAPVRSGWTGGGGPAIDPATWPRGPVTGLPMMHVLTLHLPADCRRRGPDFPAIAFFQGEGELAERLAAADAPDDPFARDLASTRPHAQLQLLRDAIDGVFALIWLTEAEFAGGPVAPPPDVRPPGSPDAGWMGCNAWDDVHPTTGVWLAERVGDPNVGVPPVEVWSWEGSTAYQEPLDAPWAEPLIGWSHLGGTAFPTQGMPEGLTAYYLEIEEFSGANFGGGSAQVDLESGVFDWACT
jgi:hypothetical protein